MKVFRFVAVSALLLQPVATAGTGAVFVTDATENAQYTVDSQGDARRQAVSRKEKRTSKATSMSLDAFAQAERVAGGQFVEVTDHDEEGKPSEPQMFELLDNDKKNDGVKALVKDSVGWLVGWVFMFYFLAWIMPIYMSAVNPSTKRHENNKYWMARCVIGIFHALLVTALALPAMFVLIGAKDAVQFGRTDHLARCAIPAHWVKEHGEGVLGYADALSAVALAGEAFTTFTMADIVISLIHGLATFDYVVHHIAFIVAGLIIRGYCMLPFTASVLLSMEASTPFLNYMLMYRNRGEEYGLKVAVSGSIFFVLYCIMRIFLNIWSTFTLWRYWVIVGAMPKSVPRWEDIFMLVAVTLGTLVQVAWFPGILKVFGGKLAELCSGIGKPKDEPTPAGDDVVQQGGDDASPDVHTVVEGNQ